MPIRLACCLVPLLALCAGWFRMDCLVSAVPSAACCMVLAASDAGCDQPAEDGCTVISCQQDDDALGSSPIGPTACRRIASDLPMQSRLMPAPGIPTRVCWTHPPPDPLQIYAHCIVLRG